MRADSAPYKPIRTNTVSSMGNVMTYDYKYPGVSLPCEKMSKEELASLSGPVEVYTIEELERREAAQ